jgi:tRNA (cytosine34-C5)-methyltransferase
LCAAPGSKTSQLIELLHTSTTTTQTPSAEGKGRNDLSQEGDLGFVLANEMSRGRAYMLVHHIKRLQSPAFLVSSHDATLMPNVYPDSDAEGQSGKMYFDRVLADVPCSGDGTLRKNMAIWKEWAVNQAYGLHPVQVRLLERAVRMIDPVRGGRVVYSTCSVNPIENEAVIQTVLMREQHCELVEVKLPGLMTRPGVKSWKVIMQDGVVLDAVDQVPKNLQKKIPSSVFPMKESSIPLERCLRLLPQDQDTGAFFVAVIDVRPRESGVTSVSEEVKRATLVKKTKYEDQEDPFRSLGDDFMAPVLKFYGIDDIEHSNLHFITRTEKGEEVDIPKTIQLVTKSIADLYREDPRTSPANALRIVNVGIRCFDYFDGVVPDDLECRYRLNMEAINTISRLATKRIVPCSKQDLIKLLTGEHVRKEELGIEVDGLSVGGAVFEVSEAGIRVPVWISERAVKAFVSKIERPALFAHLQ